MPTKQRQYRYVGEEAAPAAAEKEPAKNKRVAPRDRVQTRLYSTAELDEFRERRRMEAAKYSADPPPMISGHNLEVYVTGASIVDGKIKCNALVLGQVQRPEGIATSKAHTVSFVVDADYEPTVPDGQ